MGVGLALAALLAAILLLAGSGEDRRDVHTAASASGSLSIANSRDGAAILKADNIAPGDVASGSVTISNIGDLDASLRLSQDQVVDARGPGGAALSSRLDLVVRETTGASAPVTLFAGKLAAMPPLALGFLAKQTARTFAFSASLPEGADNAVARASTSFRYVWTATTSPAPTPGHTPTPGPSPTPTGPPTPTRTRARAPSTLGAVRRRRDLPPRVRLRIPRSQRVLRRRRLIVHARCNEPCRIRAYVAVLTGNGLQRRTRSVRTRRLRAGQRVRLAIPLPRGSRNAIRRALRRQGCVGVTLVLRARDDRGHLRVVRQTIYLVRGRARGRVASRASTAICVAISRRDVTDAAHGR